MKRANESPKGDASIFTRTISRSHLAKDKLSKGYLRTAGTVLVMLALIMSLCLPAIFETSAVNWQDPHEREKTPTRNKNTGSGKDVKKRGEKQSPRKKKQDSRNDTSDAAKTVFQEWAAQENEVAEKLANSFVKIPAGEFMMGSENGDSDEKPVHRVRISRPFELGKYEITQALWQAVMGRNPSNFRGANLPVEQVSWNDAQQFIQKLNARNDGYVYRLPTEAEWEYACRSGTTNEFAYGNSLSSVQANFDGNYPYGNAPKGKYLERTAEVGSYQPNAWGLYDMHGNVWEWCQDWYGENYYAQSPGADPQGPASGSARVLRGGGWNRNAQNLRSAHRNGRAPDDRALFLGFRLVRTRR